MTIKKTYLFIGAVALLVVGFTAGAIGIKQAVLGGSSFDTQYFGGDIHQGVAGTLMMQSGQLVGPINTSQSVTLSGKSTVQCPVIYNGASTTVAYYLYSNGAGSVITTTTKPVLCP